MILVFVAPYKVNMEVVNARSLIIYTRYLPLNEKSKFRTRCCVKSLSPLLLETQVAEPLRLFIPLLTTLCSRRLISTVLAKQGRLTCFQYY
ncbi:hypothetical protein K443DRAFT_278300 [Laccaria amethystina LaAM-08-1]|uniref:Uncharacterized protein n=1 Tax=Laccaria amethystina LaAM-08-1 TaxID=1095629 RepID=A0A0C9XMQ2_9AGAR|nr:hypothetical protein K443DRAFT_278300 [Laccaria amethystina LaAM-08-1]